MTESLYTKVKTVSSMDRISELSASITLLNQKVSDSFEYITTKMDDIDKKIDTRIDDLKDSFGEMCKIRHASIDDSFSLVRKEIDDSKSWGKYKVTVYVGILATVISSVLSIKVSDILKPEVQKNTAVQTK